jgi:hypothetical protein
MKQNYVELVKAIRRGTALAVTGYSNGHTVGNARWNGQHWYGAIDPSVQNLGWERANYDFGHLLDRRHPDWIGTEAYNRCLEDGWEQITQGTFFLPHPETAYLFHCVEDEYDFNRAYCVLLGEADNGVAGSVFMQHDAPAGTVPRTWIMDCTTFHFDMDGAIAEVFGVPETHATDEVLAMIKAKTAMTVEDVIVATMLLNSPSQVAEIRQRRSVGLDLFNRKRKASQPRIDAPRVVHINRTRLLAETVLTSEASRSGAVKSPHMRRAHPRVLWRGTDKEREIKVRASMVNGGKEMQSYKVKPQKQPHEQGY